MHLEIILKDGIYNIKTGLDKNRYVEITNESTSNLANVQIWSKTNKQNQQIKLTYLNEGYSKTCWYKFEFLCIDVCSSALIAFI